MKKIFPFLLTLLVLTSCGKDDDNGDSNLLNRDKFIGNYDITFECLLIEPNTTSEIEYTKIFFIELPNESLGLANDIVIFRGLFFNDSYNFKITGNNFNIITSDSIPIAEGFFENGDLIFTQFKFGNYDSCTTPITATRRN
jgi:hypothetical protein